MVPANARKRHKVVEDRLKELSSFANSYSLNRIEMGSEKIGVICSGVVYNYVKEALPEASVLKLGMVWPLPVDLVRDFSKRLKTLRL